MKKYLSVFLGLMIRIAVIAQEEPVQLHFSAERKNDSIVNFVVEGKIAKGVKLFEFTTNEKAESFVSMVKIHIDKENAVTKTAINGTPLVREKDKSTGLDVSYYLDSVHWELPVLLKNNAKSLVGTIDEFLSQADSFPTKQEVFRVRVREQSFNNADSSAATSNKKEEKGLSGMALFLFCFLTGLAAVFTPCVFPLIPVTVSFFLKRSKTKAEGIRNAWIYSLSIILIYTIPTLVLTLIFGNKFLYQVSTHPISNLLFFVIFIIFAISFLGAFELNLPSSWANKADEGAGKGGILGTFFMALTLVIVSFSCTGPIVAGLLSQTSGQGVSLGPVIGMAGFGLGLAIPFGIFALFPSMLKSLPKSGGWLNTVKVFFGFIELALAMKFLLNVDLAYHWHLLNRDVFLVIWIVIFALLGMYLLGKLKFSHDSDLPFISVPRLFFAIASFCFALYMVPGLWGAPLKSLSGLLPPPATQEFNLNDLQYKIGANSGNNTQSIGNELIPQPKKYVEIFHVPFGLKAYYDMDEGLAASKIARKPVMIDFTGWSCANCRKMENEVWSNPAVLKKMREDFILVSLYVDDKTDLPENEQIKKPNGEHLITIGDKNLDFEQTTFNLNAQPLYMFVDGNAKPLSEIRYGYNPDINKFLGHLDMVKAEFKKRNP